MMSFFSNIAFLNPWILSGLAALPVLWFLLRITPPAPKLIALPTTRFLAGLIPETQTPDRTPWWILLLRLLIAALVLLALSHPVYNPATGLPGTGPVRIVMDNGWAAAQTWDRQIKAATESLSQAAREEREIYILTTAPAPSVKIPASFGPLAGTQAGAILKGLKPVPWPADYAETKKLVEDPAAPPDAHSFWFAHGLDEGGFTELAVALQNHGGLTYTAPAPENLPLLLKQPETASYNLEIAVDAPRVIPENLPVSVQALTENGRVLDIQNAVLNAASLPQTFTFDIPETLRNDVSSFRIAGRAGVGSIFILDERFRKRSVGIVGPADDAETKPFIEATYYLKRALEPYTTLHMGSVDDVLAREPSVIILPDIGAMPAHTLSALEKWVQDGGLLLRFAGPKMTEGAGAMFLTPLPLRLNARSTEGNLSWENPPKLKEFPQTSPLYGLAVPDDIVVRRQILPEPVQDLEEKTWALLDDGTPLITASPLEKGLLVMIHTSASPEWSDLALSGVYVEILRRIVSLSGKSQAQLTQNAGSLQPVWVFDGFGAVQRPDASARPIPATEFVTTPPGPEHPPGLYAQGSFQQALNLGNHITALKTPAKMPAGVHMLEYGTHYEQDLMPLILYAAMALLLFDWLVIIIMMTELRILARFTGIAVLLLCVPAQAQDYESDIKYTDGLYLAYIKSGDAAVDTTAQTGLENIAAILNRRTSTEPAGVAALDPEVDTLAFFPLIYWPVTGEPVALSDKALKNIQGYLDHGGTILFDTREQNYAASSLGGTQNTDSLRLLIGALNIPPLAPINKDHVLGRSFYLIDSFPGKYSGGTLWVESDSANGHDGVSSVIIGSNDWASAWAAGNSERTGISGGTRQQEMANRFGVNLVMYALTGNYKADQVHVPHILERLGQ